LRPRRASEENDDCKSCFLARVIVALLVVLLAHLACRNGVLAVPLRGRNFVDDEGFGAGGSTERLENPTRQPSWSDSALKPSVDRCASPARQHGRAR
jgi:hypothetical protein